MPVAATVPAKYLRLSLRLHRTDELNDVLPAPGTHLYLLVSAERRRVLTDNGARVNLERQSPAQTWEMEAAFNLPSGWKAEATVPPHLNAVLTPPDGEGQDADPILLYASLIASLTQQGAVAMPRIPLDVHYVGKTWGPTGQKSAAQRLTEGHQGLGRMAAWLGNNHPERVGYVAIATPAFHDARVRDNGDIAEIGSSVPVTAGLVGATEGLLIQLLLPCCKKGHTPCAPCHNRKVEVAQLDALHAEGFALTLAGGPDAYVFRSPHGEVPPESQAITCPPSH